ncbi:YdeI/OmpD-associated family protein [uncultured Castellaniella sp.]|uniref:YdeI/OmpD-associated family protein n=1 Tax=uncultured Castellaniella sp. TaxID=647907 RepID=UPI0026164F64|nr:YdeI/OmpD-associated family protein [uncultured Castellaniella sp.]
MITFKATLLQPADHDGDSWTFLVLPKSASDALPRRGRTSIEGTLNGHPFQARLEPDGQLSHWLRVDRRLREAARARVGDLTTVQFSPVETEPEPQLPDDLQEALAASPAARAVWDATTTIARVDWIHWIESARQTKTRARRVHDACDMLAAGKKRVCCFDPSGYYSKSLQAPRARSVQCGN